MFICSTFLSLSLRSYSLSPYFFNVHSMNFEIETHPKNCLSPFIHLVFLASGGRVVYCLTRMPLGCCVWRTGTIPTFYLSLYRHHVSPQFNLTVFVENQEPFTIIIIIIIIPVIGALLLKPNLLFVLLFYLPKFVSLEWMDVPLSPFL